MVKLGKLRPALLFRAILAFLAAQAAASPFLEPGESFLSSSSWEAAFWLGFPSSAPPEPGFGAKASFGWEGLPLERAWLELGVGYRWLDPSGPEIDPFPSVSLRAGYRLPVFSFMALSPFAGVEFILPTSRTPLRVAPALDLGLRAAFRMNGRKYLCLSPGFVLPFDPDVSPAASLSVSFRNEEEWRWGRAAVSAESVSLATSLPIFSPDGDKVDDSVDILVKGVLRDDGGPWALRIVSPSGKTHKTFKGNGPIPAKFAWDGGSDSGRVVEPGEDYSILLETGSWWSKKRVAKTHVTIDILLVKEGDRYKIRVPDIRFPPDSYELGDEMSTFLVEQNRMALSRIALLFKRFPGYSLGVEGHANSVHWADPEAYEREEREELLPLSELRAQAVKDALMSLGVDGARIKARAFGGTRPIFAFSDSANAWKNRRVEFILSRQ